MSDLVTVGLEKATQTLDYGHNTASCTESLAIKTKPKKQSTNLNTAFSDIDDLCSYKVTLWQHVDDTGPELREPFWVNPGVSTLPHTQASNSIKVSPHIFF